MREAWKADASILHEHSRTATYRNLPQEAAMLRNVTYERNLGVDVRIISTFRTMKLI
jgi:hypothetical protein